VGEDRKEQKFGARVEQIVEALNSLVFRALQVLSLLTTVVLFLPLL